MSRPDVGAFHMLGNHKMKLHYRLIYKLMRLYWKVTKPITIGVRAIITNNDNEVLLVKHTYTHQWYLPGGGVNKGEHLLDALNREMDEELGLKILYEPTLLGTYSNFYEGKSDYVSVFVIDQYEITPNKNREIEAWKMYDVDNLPKSISPGSHKRMQEYLGRKVKDYKW